MKRITAVVLVILLLLPACGLEPIEMVEPMATLVVRSPTHTPVPPTVTPTPTPGPTSTPLPTETPTPTLREAVKTLCLSVNASFSHSVTEIIRSVMTELGMKVVDQGTECDGTLTISMSGQALGADYKHTYDAGTSHCYTGAEVSGEMNLVVSEREMQNVAISVERSPSSGTIVECPRHTSEAPFDSVADVAVLYGLAKIWGYEVLLEALAAERIGAVLDLASEKPTPGAIEIFIEGLRDERPMVRRYSAEALGQIGKEAMEAVPSLIEALGDESMKGSVRCALNVITGRDFGVDAAAWRNWWEKQQQ